MTSKMSLPKNYVPATSTTEASGKVKDSAARARREYMERLRAEDSDYSKDSPSLKQLSKTQSGARRYYATGRRKEKE